MIRIFGLYLMTESELMELDEKWLAMLSDIQKNQQAGLIVHEAPFKWKYDKLPVNQFCNLVTHIHPDPLPPDDCGDYHRWPR